jgi:hypothetical protein
VAGPESANNAGAQTSFIPLLTLGIPERCHGDDGRRDDDSQYPARATGDDVESGLFCGLVVRCGSAT